MSATIKTAAASNGAHASAADRAAAMKIKLYTNHGCPYAHRAHIALAELGLACDETIIDLTVPREPWYLDINPRGLVPTIQFGLDGREETLIESAIVAQFLAESFPSHLLPAAPAAGQDPTPAALQRARINFFIDTWNAKAGAPLWAITMASDAAEKERLTGELVAIVEKELEPLLRDARPFFGGSAEFTLAEVMTAPFVLRWQALSMDGELVPRSLWTRVGKLEHFSKWAAAVVKRESVLGIWDEEKVVVGMKKHFEKRRAAAAAATK